ncbi:tetratricopeptide repeat protein [Rhodoferax sp.]|uniref:L,D-transpeptidase Cds6 family protein n=1 Tax=Rhodoferax sp. TaxID=50421 RepID=UPI001ECBF861|nr:tetratricopeptide repeat protein [Rhodoferax sp.]MBT9507106.1 tetratricopeptide repeat protein [Rhodoferax sp.]
MKHVRSSVLTSLRLLTLATICFTSAAQADEYADVSQLLRAGKLTEALINADIYLAAKPRDPQMRFLKGVIQRDAGKIPDAITTFTKLTEDYPELPEPYNNLAVLYAGQSQYDKARTALEMAIRTNPSYATAHENLGDVYAKLASQAYNKALQLDSTNTAVQPKLALIRELFNPNLKGVRPAMPMAPTAAPPVALAKPPLAPAPAPAVARPPAATAPAPVVAVPAAAAPVAPPVAVASPAAAPAPAAAVPVVKPPVSDSAAKDAEAALRAWAKAWAAKDVSAYLGAYGKEFTPPGKQSRSAWEMERRKRITGKSSISVKLENLSVTINGNKAVIKFRQDYRADALSVSSRKTIDMVKTGERWLIVRESTGS